MVKPWECSSSLQNFRATSCGGTWRTWYCNGPNRFHKLRILIFKIIQRNVLSTVHLWRKCWSVVNFIDGFVGKSGTTFLKWKSANLSLKMQVRVRSEHNTKITVSWEQKHCKIYSFDNLMLAGFKLTEPPNQVFIRLIYFLLAFSNWWHIIKGRDLQIRNHSALS
jgi:hypothetical protein